MKNGQKETQAEIDRLKTELQKRLADERGANHCVIMAYRQAIANFEKSQSPKQ